MARPSEGCVAFYVGPDGNVGSDGPLEITQAPDRSFVFDAGPDGESLALGSGRWHDPFEPPLSAENQAYVDSSGKWTAFDLTGGEPWAKLVGHSVDVTPLLDSRRDKVIGASLRTPVGSIEVRVEFDELVVTILEQGEHQ